MADFGNREDGTKKSTGYFGVLPRPDGSVSTELSIGVNFDGKEHLIPALVPTLNKDEINYLLSGKKPTNEIVDKAVEHARIRISQGKSPFASSNEAMNQNTTNDKYDIEAMRSDGYSDSSILKALHPAIGSQFNVKAMLDDGYSESNILDAYSQANPALPPKEQRGAISEIGRQVAGSVYTGIPAMAAGALEWWAPQGSMLEQAGKDAKNYWETKQKEWEPDLQGRGPIASTLIQGASQLGPSLAGMGAAILNPIAGGALVATVFGGQQAQSTWDKAKEANLSDSDAADAAYKTGLIEGFGETVADVMGAKFLMGGGKLLASLGTKGTVDGAVKLATSPKWAMQFAKNWAGNAAVQSGTEYGQGYGEAYVEQQAGLPTATPHEAGAQGAQAALGMSVLLGPLGVTGASVTARKRAEIGTALTDNNAPAPVRMAAAQYVANDIEPIVGKEKADKWLQDYHTSITQPTKPSDILAAPTIDDAVDTFKSATGSSDTALDGSELLDTQEVQPVAAPPDTDLVSGAFRPIKAPTEVVALPSKMISGAFKWIAPTATVQQAQPITGGQNAIQIASSTKMGEQPIGPQSPGGREGQGIQPSQQGQEIIGAGQEKAQAQEGIDRPENIAGNSAEIVLPDNTSLNKPALVRNITQPFETSNLAPSSEPSIAPGSITKRDNGTIAITGFPRTLVVAARNKLKISAAIDPKGGAVFPSGSNLIAIKRELGASDIPTGTILQDGIDGTNPFAKRGDAVKHRDENKGLSKTHEIIPVDGGYGLAPKEINPNGAIISEFANGKNISVGAKGVAPAIFGAKFKAEAQAYYEGLKSADDPVAFSRQWANQQQPEGTQSPQSGNQKPRAQNAERRLTNEERRKRYAAMSPEELRAELEQKDRRIFTSHLTGLPNKAAYEDSEKLPIQAFADIDGLKEINDTLGHDVGDVLIKTLADALGKETKNAYHISGDEFYVQGETIEEVRAVMDAALKTLSETGFEYTGPDGKTITKTGMGFSYGTATNIKDAEVQLYADKQARRIRGLRAERAPAATVAAQPKARGETQGFALKSESNAEAIAKEEAAVKARKESEAKAKADEEVSGFKLTGSNREADVGMAHGQADLLAQPSDQLKQSALELIKASDIPKAEQIRLAADLEAGKVTPEHIKSILGETQQAKTATEPVLEKAENLKDGLAETPFKIGKNPIIYDGQEVGYIKLDDTGNALRIADIEITSSSRRKGIGSDTIKKVMEQAKAENKPLVLTSDAMRGKEGQKLNRAWYEKLGFQKNKDFVSGGVKEEYIWNASTQNLKEQPPEKPALFSQSDQDQQVHRLQDSLDITREEAVQAYMEGERIDSEGKQYQQPGFSKGETTPKGHTPEALTTRINSVLESQANGLSSLMGPLIKVHNESEIPARILGGGALYQAVYHGSPYKFDKFSLDHIGKGEGAQAYGWGLYFTGKKEIAEYYRNKLAAGNYPSLDVLEQYFKPGRIVNGYSGNDKVLEFKRTDDGWQWHVKVIQVDTEGNEKQGERPRWHSTAPSQKEIEKVLGKQPAGQLYKVDIPEDDTYLLWDKPLNEQPEKVKAAFSDIRLPDSKMDGHEIYSYIKELEADKSGEVGSSPSFYNRFAKAASKRLHALGISGIKYLAGDSRSKGEGNYNYVVFSDEAIQITDTLYSKSNTIRAYVDPTDNSVHIIADNLPDNWTDEQILGLLKHEISVHVLKLGKSDAEFQSILKQADTMRKAGNKAMRDAYDRAVAAETPEENLTHEMVAYYIEQSPTASLTQKFIAWFRKMLRSIGQNIKGMDKLRVIQWANKLSEGDIIQMASEALKNAPSLLQEEIPAGGMVMASKAESTDQTDTPAFKAWFGDSKVVEPFDSKLITEGREYEGRLFGGAYTESRITMQRGTPKRAMIESARNRYNDIRVELGFSKVSDWSVRPSDLVQNFKGKPLVVYHGTQMDFEEFVPWSHFGSSVQANQRLADVIGTGQSVSPDRYRPDQRILPVYLALRNPLRLNDVGSWGYDKLVPELVRAGIISKKTGDSILKKLRGEWHNLKAQTWEYRNGYEQIIEAKRPQLEEGLKKIRENSEREIQSLIESSGYDGIVYRNKYEHGIASSDSYIAFNPTQIKSAIGNRGTFSPTDANILFSKAPRIIGEGRDDYTPAQLAAMDRTGSRITEKTIKENLQSIWQDAGKKAAQGLVDQFRPVRDLSAKAYTLLRLSKGATGAFEAFMNYGKLSIKDGATDADRTGGVLAKVFYPIGRESTDFLRWVAGNRAERLAAEGKERLFTPEDIAAFKSLSDGMTNFDYTMPDGSITRDRTKIYADTLKKFNEFNKNALDIAEQSGLIDPESRHLWEHEFYVPFYRMMEEEGGIRGMNIKSGVVRQEAFKKLKGGEQQLNDLLSNTLMNWAHLIDASAKNRAAILTIHAAVKAGVARKAETGEKNTVWVMAKGQKLNYKVEDAHLLTAISSLEYAGMRGPAMKAMSTTKHWLTIGVTASPFFKVRNLIRDSVQAIATADLSYNIGKNIKEGYKLTDRKAETVSQEYVSALAGGGLIRFGTMLEGNEASRVRQLIKAGSKDIHILDNESKVQAMVDKYIEPAFTAYNELGNRGEEINRLSLYHQMIEKGMDHATASLMARDLMDFSMQGAWTSVRFLTQIVPFMNARAQGMYKLGRAAKEDNARFAIVLGAVSVASLALLAAYGDDDDWKKREDWDRDNYWWFKIGGEAFRIPKPFEIGAIATLAERSAEAIFDKEMTGERFRDTLAHNLSNQLSMNPIPQLVKPIIDVYANKDSFTGRPIETMGMEKLAPDYRYRQSTSMVARGISTAGNTVTGDNFLSPVQIDHLVRAYFSWLGSFVVGGADMLVRAASNQPTKPALDYWKFGTGGMVSELEGSHSRYVTAMYDQARELEEAYGTWRMMLKEGNQKAAREYQQANIEKLRKYKSVERVKRNMSALGERARLIEKSNKTPDEKKILINQIRDKQDQLARALSK